MVQGDLATFIMKLLIDIGNTNSSIVLVEKKKILKRYFIHTSKGDICLDAFNRLFGKYAGQINEALVVSVVPRFLKILKQVLKKTIFPIKIEVVGTDVIVPIKNNYKNPKQVGQDRLVTAYAAVKKYGSPAICIDFGTAVTFDFVNKKGEYEGGMIFPGLRIALKALVHDAALLPKINIRPTAGIIGKDTMSSMNNGVVRGYAKMCDGLIEEIRQKYGKNAKVIATGGDAKLISKYSKHMKRVVPDLIFHGLIAL